MNSIHDSELEICENCRFFEFGRAPSIFSSPVGHCKYKLVTVFANDSCKDLIFNCSVVGKTYDLK